MTRDEIGTIVCEELKRLAPEVDVTTLAPNTRLREELDLDSFDFSRFVAALDTRFGVAAPEVDYAQLQTLDSCISYVLSKRSSRRTDV